MISIIMPTYNESENISLIIEKIDDVLKKQKFELIVVDDNSPDGTAEIIKKLKTKYTYMRLIQRNEKMGLGSAYKDAFKKARGNIIITMDADFSHEPEYLPEIIEKMIKYDVVVCSRYIKEGKRKDPFLKRILPFFGNNLYKLLDFPTTDALSGFRAYRKTCLDEINLNKLPDDFSFQAAIIFELRDKKIVDIPLGFKERRAGTPKYSNKELYGNIKLVLKVLPKTKLFKFSVVGGIGTIINLIFLYLLVETFSLWYILSGAIAFIIALTSNFILNKRWTFENEIKEKKIVMKQYTKFTIVSTIGLMVNLCILYVLVEYFDLWYILAQFIGILSVMVINFLGSKKWVFK